MDAVKETINKRLNKVNRGLPASMANPDLTPEQTRKEIKRYKNRIIQNKARNIFIILFACALSALILGETYYLHCGITAFTVSVLLLLPTAKNTRVLLNAEHKIFALEMMESCQRLNRDLSTESDLETNDITREHGDLEVGIN